MINGPAKGVGAAVIQAFAAEYCRLVLVGRDTAAINPIAQAVIAQGGEAIVVRCDLPKPDDCEAVAAQACQAFGGVDILINIAGGSGPIGKTGVETTPAEFDDIVSLNMNGCFHSIRAVAPLMMAQRRVKIVNVGSTFGLHGRTG